MSTLHVGPDSGVPERYRIILKVHTDRDLQQDEKQRVIDQARKIIEPCLQSLGYPRSALETFIYGVMYSNSDRNMKAVGAALRSVQKDLASLKPPIVSTCHLGPFGGEPDGFTIYLSIESKVKVSSAERSMLIEDAKALVQRALRSIRYNQEAIDSFSYELVSQEEIDKAGGWYPFLR